MRIVPFVNTSASTTMGHSPVNVELTTQRHKTKEAVLVMPYSIVLVEAYSCMHCRCNWVDNNGSTCKLPIDENDQANVHLTYNMQVLLQMFH